MALPLAEKSFIQSMMASGALTAKKTALLFNECVQRVNNESRKVREDGRGLDRVLDRINRYVFLPVHSFAK